MYPLTGMYKVNPLREFWLPLILSDEMWFYTILYSVARHFTAGQMQHNSSDAAVLASLVIPRLRNCIERNTKGEVPTDIALAAIACMAATEVRCRMRTSKYQWLRLVACIWHKAGV